jgi:hypothetical protein
LLGITPLYNTSSTTELPQAVMSPSSAPDPGALATLKGILEIWKTRDTKSSKDRFGSNISKRLEHVEATITPLNEAPKKLQAQLVSEITVTEGILLPHCSSCIIFMECFQTCVKVTTRCMAHALPS